MPEQTIAARLAQLGIVLPEASEPAGKYANFVHINGLVFVSGKGPPGNPKGKLGRDFTTAEGYEFARLAGIEVLAVLQAGLGSLDRVRRVVKVQGFVNADPRFEEPHKVLNGFSDLMLECVRGEGRSCAFGVRGRLAAQQSSDRRGFDFCG
jgi:enamine deaminase RidA (YjgF/YER057c/UK114 family)